MSNPKVLLFLIALFLAGSGFLGWKMWNGDTLSISWFNTSSEVETANVLDKFSDEGGAVSIEKDDLTAKLIDVSGAMSVSPTNGSRNGSVLYYERAGGRILETFVADMSTRQISGELLSGFINSIWSPDKKSVISLFATDRGTQYKFYNLVTQKSATLPLNTRSVVFSPDSSQIAFFVTTGTAGGIYLSSSDGSNPKKILETRIADLHLYWPVGNLLFFLTKNPNTDTSDLVRIGDDGHLENILTDKKDLAVIFSRDGSRILFSAKKTDGLLYLGHKNLAGQVEESLPVVTSADSCAWSIDNDTVYCGIAENNLGNSDLSAQNIYRFSVVEKKQVLVYKSTTDKALHLQSPILSPLEDYLFFVNGFDGHLYSLKIE